MVDNSLGYAYEKAGTAIYTMAEGWSDLATRIWDAWTSSLMRLQPGADLPEDLRGKFLILKDMILPHPEIDGEGTQVIQKLSRMDSEELGSVAHLVVEFCFEVVRRHLAPDY